MTDKELLELAAKAAGVELTGADRAAWLNKSSYGWNPLTDDGDALRLAVKLKMWTHSGMGCFQNELDPLAATRRVIVRAAAEIGRNMT